MKQTTDITIDREYLGHVLIKQGFETWFRYMFRVIEQKPFIMEAIHAHLFKGFQCLYDRTTKRLIINIPPRSGKTTLAKYFLIYCITLNPRCNFIYTSYSQELLALIAQEMAAIMEHPVYKAMYPGEHIFEEVEADPVDEFWKDYLIETDKKNKYTNKRIVTRAGGVLLFASVGASITGFGCFDYNTLVATEKGYMTLGDIVENKIDVKVLSYNFDKKKLEYQKIYKYVKNEISSYMQITLDNGEKINCTPDHIFYTDNFEEKRADELSVGSIVFSNSFNFPNRYAEPFCDILSGIVFIKNKINFFLRKTSRIFVRPFSILNRLKTKTSRNLTPYNPAFNVGNTARSNIVKVGYLFIWSFILGYLYGLLCRQLLEFSIVEKFIVGVLLCCAIFKIFKTIIRFNVINMPCLFRTFANKSSQHKTMDKTIFFHAIYNKVNSFISFVINTLLHYFIGFSGKYLPVFRNKIPVKFRNRKIVDIIYCNHKAPSYCLTLWNNNNLFVTKSQVMVHNCGIRGSKHFSGALIIDDANKPADITSQLMREKVYRYYYETLLTRLNDSNVAICNIQQRLHVEDLSGYLMKEYDFEVIRQPLIDEQGQCQVPSQYTKERIKELRINESTWLAQYQQTPIAEKGQIIQRQWWKYYEREAINQDRTPKYPIKGAIIMTADTAYKKGKDNDLSCIQVWEIARGVMRMREMIVGRWNFPELLQKAKYIWAKWTDPNKPPAQRAKYFFIEDKASGTSLEQTLTVEGIEAIAWKPKDFDYPDDKVGRMREASFDVFKGMIELPYGDPMTEYLVNEAALFSEDDSHAHDDSCDAFTMAHSIWRHYGGNQ